MKQKQQKKQQGEMKKTYKIRVVLGLSIFAVIVASSIINSAIIAIINFSGLFDLSGTESYASMMISMVFSMIIGGVITIAWGQTFLNPICELIDATKKVAHGEYGTKVDIKKRQILKINTDLVTLGESFNQMTAELSNTEMFRKDFISNFSHEFKTPILSIGGFAEQIYRGNLTEEEQKEFARIIMEESRRLSALSANVLLLTSYENKDIVTDQKWFSLDEQLRSCVLLFEEKWEAKELELDIDLEKLSYYQNEEMLSILWKNLISNAVKYTPAGGSISVKCHRIERNIVVHIKDSGIGMDEDTVKHIFDKFYQNDSSHATEGNGLGMSIVNQILHLIGAQLQINSQLGVGSEFIVLLPELQTND